MNEMDSAHAVSGHYGRVDLGAAILEGLRATGKDPDALTPDDLAPVDQLHSRGKAATLELARLAGLHGDERVLDVGGGIGGPARTLAAVYDVAVTVLDLTEAYCRVGEMLSERTRLGHRVSFQHGTALDMPFPDQSFDVVWTQHSSMNIEDKERLYAEIHRVLRPGGRLALHEIMAGPIQPIHFPAHWAPEPTISFLRTPEEIRALLHRLGFGEQSWVDVTGPSLEWARERAAAIAGGALPPFGQHLWLGPLFADAVHNVVRNLEEQRIVVIEGVLDR